MYRVIHKSLRDFRPLRYSSRDGNAEGELVNKGRDTPCFLSYLTGARYVHPALSVLVVAQPSLEVPEGLMNYPVYIITLYMIYIYNRICTHWTTAARTLTYRNVRKVLKILLPRNDLTFHLKPCHDLCCYSLTSYCRYAGSIRSQFKLDMWWTIWQCQRLFSCIYILTCPLSLN